MLCPSLRRERFEKLGNRTVSTGQFVITGFRELDTSRLGAIHVTEQIDGELVPTGQVRLRAVVAIC
jgi:hypothetical protein